MYFLCLVGGRGAHINGPEFTFIFQYTYIYMHMGVDV
jgi:hypothetical protein